MSKWISVKERLPKLSTPLELHRVVVWDSFRGYWLVGWYFGGHLNEWRVDGSPSKQDGITHWMEITPPMKRRKK